MIQEIAPGIYTADQPVAEGKNGIIFGSRAALAIDTGNGPEDGQAMADAIRARGRAPLRLALTHGHGDHILGSGAFAGAEVFASHLTPGRMRAEAARIAARAGRPVEEIEAGLAFPTVTFTGELRIDLGGRTARLFPTPGHSADSVSVYIEEERLLFAGDTVVTAIVPAIADGDGREMEASLARLRAMEIELLVPGHGSPLLGRAQVREWLAWQAEYLARVRERVRRELARGAGPEAAADAAEYAECVGAWLPAEKHGMPRRHRAVAAKIAAEEGSGR